MLRIVTLNSGNYCGLGTEYVLRLYDMVIRNLPEGFKGTFTCFTDNPKGLHAGIDARPLPTPGLEGWWNKLALFQPGLFPAGDRILFLDLDTLITGPLEKVVAYDGPFAILRDFYRSAGLGSCAMAWEAGSEIATAIWDGYVAEGLPQSDPGGDQVIIERHLSHYELWQNVFPGDFVSFKVDARFGIPEGAKIVCFHGRPRPHEVNVPWVHQVWKVGGGTSAELVLETNVPRATIEANIRAAQQRQGNWLKIEPNHDGEVLVCAGGPSLADDLNSIKLHQANGALVYAVNGTYAYLLKHGILPHAQVICDARPENSGFVPALDHPVERLYASQCDATVLDAAGPNLTLWHPYFDGVVEITGPEDKSCYVGGGTTAGLKAVTIAYARGCRKIHLYGFDSSYRGDDNHAYAQPLNNGERLVDVELPNGECFRAAPWMVTQAEDFQTLAAELTSQGCQLFIHGDGLLPSMAALAEPSRLPVDLRAQAILSKLNGVSSPKAAEVGVFVAELSKRLLANRPDLSLYMVDSWSGKPSEDYVDSGDFHADLPQYKQDEFCDIATAMTSFAQERAIILRQPSIEAAQAIPDASLDLVFIDANHSYEGCKSDLEAWFPKVKPGGIVSGHDYENSYHPNWGVKRAVDEFCGSNGFMLELGEDFTWFATKEG